MNIKLSEISKLPSDVYDHDDIRNLVSEYITECKAARNGQYVIQLTKANLLLVDWIKAQYPAVKTTESLYRFIHNISTPPTCEGQHCDNVVSFNKVSSGYANYCCRVCSNESPKRSAKIAATNNTLYGATNYLQSVKGKQQVKKSVIDRYGVDHYSKTAAFKQSFEATMTERYGVKYAMQSKLLSDRYKKSMEASHGVSHPSQSPTLYKARGVAMKKKYGVEHAMQSPELSEKHRLALQMNYGVDYPIQNPEIRRRMKATMIDRYGSEYTASVDYLFEQMKSTCLDRYGVEHPMQTEEFKAKSKETCLDRYGVEHPMQTEEFKAKSKETCLDRYGVEYVMQTEEFKAKSKETCLDRYGVEYVMQTEEFKAKSRLTNEASGLWLPLELKSDIELYYRQVWKVTNMQPLSSLPNIAHRGLAGIDGAHHIDHKISIRYGFVNAIPPYLIGNIHNLEMLPWYDNIYKSMNCSISLDELCESVW